MKHLFYEPSAVPGVWDTSVDKQGKGPLPLTGLTEPPLCLEQTGLIKQTGYSMCTCYPEPESPPPSHAHIWVLLCPTLQGSKTCPHSVLWSHSEQGSSLLHRTPPMRVVPPSPHQSHPHSDMFLVPLFSFLVQPTPLGCPLCARDGLL